MSGRQNRNARGQQRNLLGPMTKTPAEIAAIEREFETRVLNGSDALKGQHQMYMISQLHGLDKNGYAVLPDGVDEYDWDKVIWISGEDAVDKVMLMRAKVEATLGKPEGIYFLYFMMKATVNKPRRRVTEQRIARQIKAEYGADPIPIVRDVENNPRSTVAMKFAQLMMEMSF